LAAVALLARLPGFDGRPLFVDELWRALLILGPQFLQSYLAPTVESAITSPIYALMIKAAAAVTVSPDSLRMPSLLCGLLACGLTYALIRRAGGGLLLGLLAGLFFALNGNFIAYSNQMKPYMFEVCIHLVCVVAWLATVSAPRPAARDWALCFAALTLAVFSTPSSVFLLPAFALSLFIALWIARDGRNLAICVLGFAGLGVLVLALYVFSWRYGASGDMLAQWATGFRQPGESIPAFLGSRLFEMWEAAFQIVVVEPPLAMLGVALLAGAVAWALVTGRVARAPFRNILIFYGALLATLCLVNGLRIWPLGALRPNLFMYAHMLAFLFLLLAQLRIPSMAVRIAGACCVLVFVLGASAYAGKLNLPALWNRLHNDGAPIEPSDRVVEDFSGDGHIGRAIAADCANHRTVLVADGVMGVAIRYYTTLDTAHRPNAALLTGNCVALTIMPEPYSDPKGAAVMLSRVLSGAPSAWILYSHFDDSEVAALKRIAARLGRIDNVTAFGLPHATGGAGYFQLSKMSPMTRAESRAP
jgi:hypothetical protein